MNADSFLEDPAKALPWAGSINQQNELQKNRVNQYKHL